MTDKPMLWIAYDPDVHEHLKNREQFNGLKPAWGESFSDFSTKQGVDVPEVGDELNLRMGRRVVEHRRLEAPETDESGVPVTPWYWTILVREPSKSTVLPANDVRRWFS